MFDQRNNQALPPSGSTSIAVYSPIIGRSISLDRQRLEGMVQAIGVGDALGLPVETWTAQEIQQQLGRLKTFESLSHNHFYAGVSLPKGTWSDDAQLTAAVMNAFADAPGYSLEAIGRRHIEAYRESTAGWGGSTKSGVEALIDGLSPTDERFAARLGRGTGNGIPMKISPVAAYLALTGGDEASMVQMVQEISSLSHRTSMSVSAGLAHVTALLYCLSTDAHSFSPEAFVAHVTAASRLGEKIYPETRGADDITERLSRAGQFVDKSPAEIIEAFGGGSCYVFDSLPFSYAFFLRNPLSFDAVIDVVNAGGDTDSNGALVGSLQGALLSKEFIPPELLLGLQRREVLEESCKRFARVFGIR